MPFTISTLASGATALGSVVVEPNNKSAGQSYPAGTAKDAVLQTTHGRGLTRRRNNCCPGSLRW
ncbi:MAG TPA: hypothetical protein VGC61_06135, partial [Pyrinomonadaceae bacterium]